MDGYRWKYFRGPRDYRQPYQGLWYQETGLTQSRGFGMFEIADLCSAIGCFPIVTINNLELASDMADFVEYCWGNSSTTWGQQRITDGHPEPYNITHIEIGNEQGLDTFLLQTIVNISSAMEQVCDMSVCTTRNSSFLCRELWSWAWMCSSSTSSARTLTRLSYLAPRCNWCSSFCPKRPSLAVWLLRR
jgi:alpha-L-arabinofuranosidase